MKSGEENDSCLGGRAVFPLHRSFSHFPECLVLVSLEVVADMRIVVRKLGLKKSFVTSFL